MSHTFIFVYPMPKLSELLIAKYSHSASSNVENSFSWYEFLSPHSVNHLQSDANGAAVKIILSENIRLRTAFIMRANLEAKIFIVKAIPCSRAKIPAERSDASAMRP